MSNLKASGDSRGDVARNSLIKAGLELFGEQGFKATTTRVLAKKAKVNIAAIPYYFGSKKGLYMAIIEFMIERSMGYFGVFQDTVTKLIEDEEINKETALNEVKRFASIMVDFFVASDDAIPMVQILTREQANPTDAFDYLYDNHISKLVFAVNKLVSIYLDKSIEDDDVKIISHALYGQILSFIVSRETIYRRLGVRKFNNEQVELIREMMMNNIEASLNRQLENK